MTTTHTIRINSNPLLQNGRNVRATRVSKSRQYGACVVATATQKTVDDIAIGLADHEAKVRELTPLVIAAQLEAGGISYKEAEAQHSALVHPWYTALFANEQKVRNHAYLPLTVAQKEKAQAMTIAEGVTDPYTGPVNAFIDLYRKLDSAQRSVAHIKAQNVVVGQQLVVSWHRDAGMAQKAMGHNAKHYAARFYALTIRTDIETVSK